ncbi:MAG: M23 family metallopeptidase [Moheibacter sp.]
MKKIIAICLVIIFCKACSEKQEIREKAQVQSLEIKDSVLLVNGFDFPVGKPDAKGYYNAQKFQVNNHLGDDWNGINGGNSDLGDPIYSIANGKVILAKDIKGGWGKVVRIVHTFEDGNQVESLYAHCDSIFVEKNQTVKKGTKIGTIGTADGQYLAHLHFEIRTDVSLPIGRGYSSQTRGYVDPTLFIEQNRN